MKQLRRVLLVLLLHVPSCGWAACTLHRVTIAAQGSGTYGGGANGVKVVFKDDRPDAQVTLFPESDLEVRKTASRSSCTAPGGVWARGQVFVSSDGRTVVGLESSGSSESLVFIDARECRRVGEVDVSNARWKAEARRITVMPLGQPKVSSHRLDAGCRPQTAAGG